MRLLYFLSILFLTFLSPSFSSNAATLDSRPIIKVGVIAPFTGDGAIFGEEVRNAITLSLEDLKNQKEQPFQYEVIYEDDQLTPAKTAVAAQKLLRVDHVDAILSFSSSTGNVVSPLTERAHVLHLCCASDPNIAKGNFNFVHATTPTEETTAFINELQKRQIKSIAILSLNQQGCIAIVNQLTSKFPAAGIQLTSSEKFNSGERDFRMTLAKILETKPQIILAEAFTPEIELIHQQLLDTKVDVPLTAIESFDLTENLTPFEGLWYVSDATISPAFSQRLQERFGQKRVYCGGFFYDNLQFIAQAYKNVTKGDKKPDPETVVSNLATFQGYPSVLGKVWMDLGHVVHSEAVVKIIKNQSPQVKK